MPSKSKKHSKTLTSSSSSRALNAEPTEMDVLFSLEEASTRYPSLIEKSAFIGQLTGVDGAFDHPSKGFKIWLSEPSIVASSFTPGSIVSVSLPSLNSKLSNTFPLSSLADECARHFGIDPGDQLADEAGNYFVLARIFPSNKVAKNQVRLSANLSNTMGCPSAGRVVFVYPAQSQLLAGFVSKGEKPNSSKVNRLLTYDCNEIILELIHSKNRLAKSRTSMNISLEKSYAHSENEVPASLRTPLNQSSFSFSNFHQLNSSTGEDPAVSSTNSDGSSIDSFDIMEVLGDENSKRLLQTCATIWLQSCCLLRGNIVTIPMLSHLYSFHVTDAKRLFVDGTYDLTNGSKAGSEVLDHANEAFLVNRDTKLSISVRNPKRQVDIECSDAEANTGGTISNLGGLSKEYLLLMEFIVSSSRDISSYNFQPIKGVLLHGPPGTGKTSLARLCARDAGVKLFTVNGSEIGSPEQSLHKVFDSARQVAPAVVFIDELDAIAPARNDGDGELSLLNLMDGICRTEGILVIAATNRPNSIEPALRRPGRLDREIEIGVPSPNQRLDILQSLLSEMDHTLLEMQVQHLAGVTHGFVGADLVALCNHAVFVCANRNAGSRNSYMHVSPIAYEECSDAVTESNCLKVRRNILVDYSDSASSPVLHLTQNISSLHLQETVSYNIHDIQNGIEEDSILKVTLKDFEKAIISVKPSAMQEVRLEVPKVNWEDVGGQREVKNQLKEVVEWPQKHQDAFNRIGSTPPSGVLLCGPPGCSKTLIARAVASEAGLNFFAVKGPELLSKWVGESEKAVRSLFAKARSIAPSIIFFDEIDGLAANRGKESDGSVSDRVISQLLVELDGFHRRVNVIVIAATNRPDRIDPALLRQGRFDRVLYVGPPNESDREEIFHIHLRKTPCNSDVSFKDLASLTEGFTGADIAVICREAALAALEENLDACEIRMQHLKTAISQVQPSKLQFFQALSSKFQRLVNSSGKEEK